MWICDVINRYMMHNRPSECEQVIRGRWSHGKQNKYAKFANFILLSVTGLCVNVFCNFTCKTFNLRPLQPCYEMLIYIQVCTEKQNMQEYIKYRLSIQLHDKSYVPCIQSHDSFRLAYHKQIIAQQYHHWNKQNSCQITWWTTNIYP